MLHPGNAHLAQSFRVVVSPAKLRIQPLCLQWKGWIVFSAGNQQERGLRVTSGDLVCAGDEVEPAGDTARGVAPRVADVESAFVGRYDLGELDDGADERRGADPSDSLGTNGTLAAIPLRTVR
jgi:hypothetical protein